MFLPMSWTSPLTVAVTIVPDRLPVPARSASRYGTSTATAFFMTRALLTTCGRNIRPAPNRSPTTFIPAISGPSIPSRGRAAAGRAPHAGCPAARGGGGARGERGLLGVLDDVRVDAGDQCVGQPLIDRPVAPGQ